MALSLPKRITDLLVTKGVISKEDLQKAQEMYAEKGGKISDILIKSGSISKDDLMTTISEELGLPLLDLSRLHVDPAVLKLIPQRIIRSYSVVPVSRIGNLLTVAMVDPLNVFAMDDLKAISKMEISPVIADEEDMREAIRKFYERSADEEITELVGDMESAHMETIAGGEEEVSSQELLRITEEAPVVKLTNLILGRAVKERASDILIEPMETSSRVRYRIDGVLVERQTPPKKYHYAIISRIKVMSNLNIAERRLPQDGRFGIKVEDRRIDFRVSVIPSSLGEKAALRILDKGQAMIDVEKLGFKEDAKKKIVEAAERPHGMILVCGPTGCGKTTTLYAILKYVDSPGKNLVTVEDPVEYQLKGINQVSINEDIGLTFAGCLRSILRQDPDVIMVGEIRDYSTVDIAIKSALTGHLVLSTLHTNTASGSIVRLVNMGVEPFLIAASTELIAAQRLVRKLCEECKEPYTPQKEVAQRYNIFDKSGKIPVIYKPKGCNKCMNTGYRGRIGIIECIKITSAIKELLFRRAPENEIKKVARQEGMVTLRENGIQNVIEGLTSLEEVLRTTLEDRESE
ncbi:MAG: ATPase, T2SS/T4P/T4SS family [Candidatus Omnitrophota bacterium]